MREEVEGGTYQQSSMLSMVVVLTLLATVLCLLGGGMVARGEIDGMLLLVGGLVFYGAGLTVEGKRRRLAQ